MCFYSFYPSHPFFGTCEASHQSSPKPEASGPNHQSKWAKQNPVGYLGLFRLLDLTVVLNKSLSIGFMYLSVNQPLGALLKQNQLHKMVCFGIVVGGSTQNKESLALAYFPRCSFRDPSDVRSIVESSRFRHWKVMWSVPWHVWKAIISCCLIWLDGRWCWCERCRILLCSFSVVSKPISEYMRIFNVKAQSSWLIVKLRHLCFNICCHGRLQASGHPKFNLALVKVKLSVEGTLKDSLICLEQKRDCVRNGWKFTCVFVGLLYFSYFALSDVAQVPDVICP